jgi:hypothetical protein
MSRTTNVTARRSRVSSIVGIRPPCHLVSLPCSFLQFSAKRLVQNRRH